MSEEFALVVDNPDLPRVLLIGDSISIGYTQPVRKLLERKANVHRPKENCQHTIYALERLDDWIRTGPWDVIHFNFGLHDLKFIRNDGQNTTPQLGKQVAPIPQYQANLRQIVAKLKDSRQLIWASTTPVPAGAEWRIPGSEAAYNQAAAAVMNESDIAINDLCAVANQNLPRFQKPQNVHLTDEGYEALGKAVATSIVAALQLQPASR